MKVLMIPRISCPICNFEFNIAQEGDTKVVKLVHPAMFNRGEPCPQVGQTAIIDLTQFEKEL